MTIAHFRLELTCPHDDVAIALDYIIPMRVITPAAGSSRVADPMRVQSLPQFSRQVEWMLRRKRLAPASWAVLPFPIHEEQLMEADAARRFQEELANRQAQRLMAPSTGVGSQLGGPAGSTPPGAGASPGDRMEEAQDMAQRIVQMPSLSQRRRALAEIRRGSETLYSLVKSRMDEIRSAAAPAGWDQLVAA